MAQIVVAQGRRMVVFSQWRRMLQLAQWAVSDLLVTNGLRSGFFSGQESPKRRTQNVVDFHDDASMRLLFCTDAGGVGLNLQRAANCCVNLELPWNPAVLEQRIGRIHRLGQKDPIDVYNLVSEDCIESRIAGSVQDKRALFTGLFDGARDEVRFDRGGSFLSQLETIVTPVVVPDLPDLPDGESTAGDTSSAADAEIDALVAAADESADAPATPAESPEPMERANDAPHVTPRVGAGVGAGTSAGVGTGTGFGAGGAEASSAEVVRRLFAGMEVRPTPDGGLRIDAAPEAAATLASVLEGLAGLLRASAGVAPIRD